MKSQSWGGFVPAASAIENFHGGAMGYPAAGGGTQFYDKDDRPGGYINFNNTAYNHYASHSSLFGAIAYDLLVQSSHQGWWHFLEMRAQVNGAYVVNGVVKKNCYPGRYKILLHFQYPAPKTPNSVANNIGSLNYRHTSPAAEGLHSMGWGRLNTQHDVVESLFVVRPRLVNPANQSQFVNLWDPAEFRGGVGPTPSIEPYPGFQVTIPRHVSPY